jgi:N-acetylglucosamine malate deacetylase 1
MRKMGSLCCPLILPLLDLRSAGRSIEESMQEQYLCDLLVIAPHPDDAELFCGGLLIQSRMRGYRTAVIDVSDAELSTLGTHDTRRAETMAATEMLGLTFRESLALPNCWFHSCGAFDSNQRENSPVMRMVRALRRTRPEVLVVPYWEERHPDHVETSKLSERAVFLAGLEKVKTSQDVYRPKVVLFYPIRYEAPFSFLVDISEVAEAKYQLIDLYRSQVARGTSSRGTLLSSSLSLRALRARDVYLGSLIGRPSAEGYITRNAVPIDDPVGHFRNSSVDQSCYFQVG